jgi:uncharacterized delta-60 repeat protein
MTIYGNKSCKRLTAWFFFILSTASLASAATWTTVSSMTNSRYAHTATLLTDGRVLVAGGLNTTTGYLTNSEIFDPAIGAWTNTGALKTRRCSHTATMLPNGTVLVAGGNNGGGTQFLASAEIYFPTTGTWTNTGALHIARENHTATLLMDGRVLVTGGTPDGTNYLNSAEIFDPNTGQWTLTAPMSQGRSQHTATLLADGTVLVTGGYTGTNSLTGAEIFSPAIGAWNSANPMTKDRRFHTATRLPDGRVLVVGGTGSSGVGKTAEIFDPTAGNWIATGSTTNTFTEHTANLLPNGTVLVSGGLSGNRVGLYDPASGNWTTNVPWLNVARQLHSATLLAGGRLLVAGGYFTAATNSVEIYDYASGTWTTNGLASTNISLSTLTLLPSGKVLAAGGAVTVGSDSFIGTNFSRVYDPATGNWNAVAPMNFGRASHTITLLPNGKILVAGGYSVSTNVFPYTTLYVTNSELYDLASDTWSVSGALNYPRAGHTTTLLPNGKVLLAGGSVTNSELYDPATGMWTLTGSMNQAHLGNAAILLPTGKILSAGNGLSELFDPAAGTWTKFTNGGDGNTYLTATLLFGGRVLLAGGGSTSSMLYDPLAGTWTNTGSMNYARSRHLATLLPNGKVLVAGKSDTTFTGDPTLLSAELYDPITGTWTLTGSMSTRRYGSAAALLPNGKFLIVGGTNLATAEIYDSGIGYANTAQPQITSIVSPVNIGSSMVVTGTNFRGVSNGSGGNNSQDSSADYPLVQLRSLGNGQTAFLPAANWGTNSFASVPVTGFSPGFAMATVFANGIQSTSSMVNIGAPAPMIFNLQKIASTSFVTNGSYQFNLYYYPGASIMVQSATTDASTPLSSWSTLGTMTEISPGIYQFIDLSAKYHSKAFYVTHSP